MEIKHINEFGAPLIPPFWFPDKGFSQPEGDVSEDLLSRMLGVAHNLHLLPDKLW
jgi:hypothetical protein